MPFVRWKQQKKMHTVFPIIEPWGFYFSTPLPLKIFISGDVPLIKAGEGGGLYLRNKVCNLWSTKFQQLISIVQLPWHFSTADHCKIFVCAQNWFYGKNHFNSAQLRKQKKRKQCEASSSFGTMAWHGMAPHIESLKITWLAPARCCGVTLAKIFPLNLAKFAKFLWHSLPSPLSPHIFIHYSFISSSILIDGIANNFYFIF